jgi:MFS family permease
VLGLSAVYATEVGMSIQRTAFFLLAPIVGGVVMQWPVGKLSDRVSRRDLILVVSVSAAVFSALAIVTPAGDLVKLLIMFGIGGAMFTLYSLVVSYTLDWTAEEKVVGASGTLVRINGTGALVGPLVTAPMMAWLEPVFFFWTIGAFFSVTVAFIAYRVVFRDALPRESERPYVPFPARATSVAFKLVAAPVKAAQVTKRVGQTVGITVGRSVSTRRHEHRDADHRFDGHVYDDGSIASRTVGGDRTPVREPRPQG